MDIRAVFEAYIAEGYCGHYKHHAEMYRRDVAALLRRSPTKGYEETYFHQDIHYQSLGFRAGWETAVLKTAAPEMLAALEEAERELRMESLTGKPVSGSVLVSIRNAIAKAKGPQ